MNKINFNPQKKHEKNKQIRDTTPIIKKTNKNIENFPLPKNNISIEFPSNLSPNSKQIKKRNLRTNSFNSFTHNKTESNNFNNSTLLNNKNKKVKSLSKEKENFRNFINFDLNKFHYIQSLNKINNNGIPFHKKEKNACSMKGLIKSNFLGNKIIKKNGFNEKENLHNSYMLSTSNLNININNVDNNQIKNKSPNNKNVKKQNFISNTCENESITFSSREKKQILSKEDINSKIEKINNELCDLMNNVNNEQKKFIFQEIEKKFNVLLIKHNINYSNVIDNLINDNNILKEQNKEFNNKLELIEKNLRNIKQENKLIKENLINKNKIINDIQNNIILFTEEFNKIKNKNETNNLKEDFTSGRKNEEESDSNISLSDNLNININKYNYNNNIKSNGSVLTKPSSKLNLNIEKNKDFNDEFLENYNEFSPSWRKEVDKMLERKKNKK